MRCASTHTHTHTGTICSTITHVRFISSNNIEAERFNDFDNIFYDSKIKFKVYRLHIKLEKLILQKKIRSYAFLIQFSRIYF